MNEAESKRRAAALGLPYTLARGDPKPRSARVAHSLRSFARYAERRRRAAPPVNWRTL